MNKSKILIIVALIIVAVVGGYFVVTGIQLRHAKLQALEDLRNPKPRAHLGFWNKSGKEILIKVTFENGDLRWFPLSPRGGSYGSYDIGKIRIERISGKKSLYAINVTLNDGADAQFNVYEHKIEPK